MVGLLVFLLLFRNKVCDSIKVPRVVLLQISDDRFVDDIYSCSQRRSNGALSVNLSLYHPLSFDRVGPNVSLLISVPYSCVFVL